MKHALLSTDVVVTTGDGAERIEDFHTLLYRQLHRAIDRLERRRNRRFAEAFPEDAA